MRRRLLAIIALGAPLLVVGALVAAVFQHGVWLIVVGAVALLLLAVTLAAGRAAFAADFYRVEARPRPGGPPSRAVLFCNPKSGDGKVESFGLVELARELGVEPVMFEPDSDIEELARDAVASGADCLGVAGGDGSQALVAAVAVEHDLPFVCVSAGTRNHFAIDLGLNADDPRAAMYAFRDAVERRVDYGTVNGRLFVNNVSLGVYAEMVQQDSYRDAKMQTARDTIGELLNERTEPFDLRFTTPEGEEVESAFLLLVANNPYVVTMSPDIGARRRLDTGALGVFAVSAANGAEAARLFAAAVVGKLRNSTFWKEFTATSFEVRSGSGTIAAGVDGEACELSAPLRFETHPRGLTLLVPKDNIESAQRRGARDMGVRDLIAIARSPSGQSMPYKAAALRNSTLSATSSSSEPSASDA